jgi:hypothetical protein
MNLKINTRHIHKKKYGKRNIYREAEMHMEIPLKYILRNGLREGKLDLAGSKQGPVTGVGEHSDESSGYVQREK